MSSTGLPTLPVPLAELPSLIAKSSAKPVTELLQPYRDFEAGLRRLYAQEPDNAVLKDPYVNVLPLFTDSQPQIKVRARDLAAESPEEQDKYIMPLPKTNRRIDNSPATVQSLKEFQHNFSVFSESALSELNWDNVVVSGSAVVNCLLPVPKEYSASKRALREYYHEKFCPASDVDLFLYGLTDEQAVEKIKEIETKVRDSILAETTTVRTKHAITICSQYPIRHVQIVLRIYKSISEILTGFDIDCSGAAYDGKQIYCTPRALQAFITQINHIDLSRRSPSYENRLSKYSHRNFEVYWPELNRSRIDPTIFERSFRLTLGLARLLVLERLPTSDSRDSYAAKRRQERGRPALNRSYIRRLGGNIKDSHEDEIAEWVEEDEVSSYHTFSIPYGPKYHAKKIEKLCYTRDLLLNAEWNQPKDRAVYLHRHPAFFGRVEDVVRDCCGYCPKPQTEEELEVAETENKIYVSGEISFLKDDPGRQEIGSFNPTTDNDWTEMAYVGNTAWLCQAIVDRDVEHVEDWLAQEGADPNKRDYTGRSPLHLAVMSSSPEIVRLLVNHKARLVARLADGRTALHLAAERGDVEIVKILMDKSLANEAEEEEKKDQRRKLGELSQRSTTETEMEVDSDESDDDVSMVDSDGELVEGDDEEDEDRSMATGSFVKVRKSKETQAHDDVVPDEAADDPDYYDINVIAWDTPASALHLAVAAGHDEVVRLLCSEYGADLLTPVKFFGYNNIPTGALFNLVLALSLPNDKAKTMIKALLGMGATCAQADLHGITVFHQFVEHNASSALETLWDTDKAGCQTALNHLAFPVSGKTVSPLIEAISNGDAELARKLLAAGASDKIDFESWLKSAKQSRLENQLRTFEDNTKMFKTMTEQPLIVALKSSNPAIALELLHRGADPNTLTSVTEGRLNRASWWGGYDVCESALDIVRKQLESLRKYSGERGSVSKPIKVPAGAAEFLSTFEPGTWQCWLVSQNIASNRKSYQRQVKEYKKDQQRLASQDGLVEKKAAIAEAIEVLGKIEKLILDKGGKPFEELHPDVSITTNSWNHPQVAPQGTGVDAPYQYVFTFGGVTDVTEARKAAYIQLFEAAWRGDLDKIKQLTLGAWDDEKNEPPLQIAVTDNNRNNPFSLAFLRGHHEVTKAILEIAQAQYVPIEAAKGLFVSLDDDSEYSDGLDSDIDDTAGPRIYQEILDEQFTIDNIGEVSMQVKSRVKPIAMLTWQCPSFVCSNGAIRQYVSHGRTLFDHAVVHNDGQALSFLLDLAMHFAAQKMDPGEEPSRFYSISDEQFRSAISRGRTELMAEMIKRTGVGLPLEDLVKETGIEVTKKPRYYQGLTVYGKKRSDWAQAGRNVMRPRATGSTTPPLIYAASAGSLESVEWFLSDAPLRHYLSFAKSKAVREDSRMKRLSQAPGGSDGAITTWFGNQRDLLIHAAVMGTNLEKATRLVEYLVQAWPSSLNAKSSLGYTPLQLACLLGRVDIVKLLIQNGADQSIREQHGENILHSALKWDPAADQLRAFLDVIDPDLRSHLFLQRTRHNNDGRTPLHFWIQKVVRKSPTERVVEVLGVLLSYSGGAELDMLDGAGDTVLHSLISCDADPDIIRAILEVRPELLYRENAVGRTPAELARDRFTSACIRAPSVRYTREDPISNITSQSPESFIDRKDPLHRSRSRCEAIWDLVKAYMEGFPGRRTLVSLSDANEVAKRLGDEFQGRRYATWAREASENGDIEEQKPFSGRDIVTKEMDTLSGLAWQMAEKENKEAEQALETVSNAS